VLRLKRAIEWHGTTNSRRVDASEANGLREFEMQRPAEMDIVRRAYELWDKRESLTAEIRNFIIRQNRNCKKQTNKPSRTAALMPLGQLPRG